MTRFFGLLSLCAVLLVLSGPTWAEDKTEKKPPDKKESTSSKVTVGDVSYVVLKSTVTGDDRQWKVIIAATSNAGDQKIHIVSGRAITAEGKTFDIKSPMEAKRRADNSVSLPEGVKVQLEMNMGALPKSFAGVNTLTRLELYGGPSRLTSGRNRLSTIPGLEYDSRTRKSKPLVLKNVPLERPDK